MFCKGELEAKRIGRRRTVARPAFRHNYVTISPFCDPLPVARAHSSFGYP